MGARSAPARIHSPAAVLASRKVQDLVLNGYVTPHHHSPAGHLIGHPKLLMVIPPKAAHIVQVMEGRQVQATRPSVVAQS